MLGVVIRRLSLLLALGPLCALAAPASTHSDFTADSITTDEATGETVGSGHAELADGAFLMTADVIRYNQKTATASAEGHVAMTRGNERLLADSAVLFREKGSFTAKHLRAGSFPFYIEGSSAEGDKDVITIHDATISYREPGQWQPTVKADTIVYSPHHYIRVGSAHLGLGQAQPIPVIHLHQSLAEVSSLSYLSLGGGYRGSLGAFLNGELHIPVSPVFKVGADVSLYTARGVMAGPAATYQSTDNGLSLDGYLKTGFIHDYGNRLTDLLGRQVPIDRGFAEWRHSQQVTDSLTLNGQFNWWKDSEVVRDFRPRDFFDIQEPDSFLEATYTGTHLFASAFTRFQPNEYNPVQQRLPEVRVDMPTTPIGLGFDERLLTSVAALEDNPPQTAGVLLKSVRFDAFYGLSRPIAPTSWLTVTPVAGARFTDYTNTTGAALPGGTSRALGELGLDGNFLASGTFDYKNPLWAIDGLRHLLTPTFSWRYIPHADKGSLYIPQIDRQSFSTYLPMLDLGDIRSIDQIRAENTLRIGVDNTLQTRDGTYGSRDLLNLNLGQDFRFKQASGQRDASDLHVDVAVMPASWVQIDLYDSYSVRPWATREIDTDIQLKDGNENSIRFGTGYLSDHADDWVAQGLSGPTLEGLNNYHFEARSRINEVYEGFVRADYDNRHHRFTDQSYGIDHVIANTWRLEYTITLYSGPRRESHFGFTVQVDTVRF